MEKLENIIGNSELADEHRRDGDLYFNDWSDTNFKPSNRSVGTPCNRYNVRQPDMHRDIDNITSGEYAFAAFGLRHIIGGQFAAKEAPFTFEGRKVYAYTPDFRTPYETDLFGISADGLYNFELLDHYQQKLSLVGVAHLHMHSPQMRGAAILSFNIDGGLRYIELRNGSSHAHDTIQLFEDKAIIKLGARFASLRQNAGRERYGVPLWSFSEDTSLTIELTHDVDKPKLEHTLPISKARHGKPTDRQHFNLRNSARHLFLPIGGAMPDTYQLDPSISLETSVHDDCRLSIGWSNKSVDVTITSADGGMTPVKYVFDFDSWHTLAQQLPLLPLEISERNIPAIESLVAFSQQSYSVGRQLLRALTGSGIDLRQA